MKPLRVAIVTRRFWPLVGGPERCLANLAGELCRRGTPVTILTACWQPQWPAELLFEDVPVVRIRPPPQGRWSSYRYLRSLARWLRSHPEEFNLLYVSQLRQEAYTALRAVGRRAPVVLRAEHVGRRGDCLWQLDAAGGRRIKRQCMEAAALVAPTRAAQRELEAAGYPRPRIAYLPNGAAIPPPRTAQTQAAARAMLAETHAGLQLPERAWLAVCLQRLQEDEGLEELLAAWRLLVRDRPGARLWLAGPATQRAAIQRQIDRLELGGAVAVVGVFQQVEDLLSAADLLVAPSPEGAPVALLEGMAAGLPIVAIDTAANRSVLADQREGLLVAAGDGAALATALTRLSREPQVAARLGQAARARAEAEFSLATMAQAHLTWFEKLVH